MHTVWDTHVGEPRHFNVTIGSYMYHPQTRQPLDFSSLYDPGDDTFTFALDTARKNVKIGLPEDVTMLVLAAHEAYHAVQCHNGDKPISSLVNPGYSDDRHEEEAWLAAVSALRTIYPSASGSIKTGGHKIRF